MKSQEPNLKAAFGQQRTLQSTKKDKSFLGNPFKTKVELPGKH